MVERSAPVEPSRTNFVQTGQMQGERKKRIRSRAFHPLQM